jgi:hypothetical protein
MKQTENTGVSLRLASSRGKAKDKSESSAYFFDEPDFIEMFNLEKKRSQRSMKPLILMRLDISGLMKPNLAYLRHKLQKALAAGIRDTDVRGWYKRGSIAGILFTDIDATSPSMREILFRRVVSRLVSQIDPSVLFKIKVTFLMYAEGKELDDSVDRFDVGYNDDFVNKTVNYNLSSKIRSLVDEASKLLLAFHF